jgi:hypothetical protein
MLIANAVLAHHLFDLNLIIASVPEDQKARIEKLARDHGLMNAVTAQRENDNPEYGRSQ